jgi:cell division protein CrgA
MPKSRSRSKSSDKRYQLEPDRKSRARKTSPKWYAPLVLGVMGLGVVVIVLNYMAILPFTGHQTQPIALLIGLGMIGFGFIGTTRIR